MPALLEAENLEAQYGATKVLHGLGFANVRNLAGGLDAWARSVDPSMRRY